MKDVEMGWKGGWLFAFVVVGCALAAVALGGCAEAPLRSPPIEIQCGKTSYEKCAEHCAKEGRGDALSFENKRDETCLCRKPEPGGS